MPWGGGEQTVERSQAQSPGPGWKERPVTLQAMVVTEARVGCWGALVPLAPPTPSPSSPPTSAGRADLPLCCSLSQQQRAHGQPVLEPHQPWAGGAYGHVEPFPVELGGSHNVEGLDLASDLKEDLADVCSPPSSE